MNIEYCANCGFQITADAFRAGKAVRADDGRNYCAKCAPQNTLNKGTTATFQNKPKVEIAPVKDFTPAQGVTRFYFCETCNKRITDQQILDGLGRDKKLKGVYCRDCAEGVTTMEFAAITDLPNYVTSSTRSLPVRSAGAKASALNVAPAQRPVTRPHEKAGDRTPAHGNKGHPETRRTPYMLTILLGAATGLALAGLFLFGNSGTKKDTGSNAVKTELVAKPTEPAREISAAPVDLPRPKPETEAVVVARSPNTPLATKEKVELPVNAPPVNPVTPPVAKPALQRTEAKPPLPLENSDTKGSQTITADFEGALDPRWRLTGAAASDEQAHTGKKSLKLAEGQTAVLTFGVNEDLPAKIRMWIYDNGKQLSDGTVATGPGWGVKAVNGDIFCLRTCWRSFLGGNTGYAWFNTGENRWFSPHWAHVTRKEGWSEWVFDFSDPKSPKAASGGANVASVAAKNTPKGAVAVYLLGGDSGTGPLYVDDIDVEYPKK